MSDNPTHFSPGILEISYARGAWVGTALSCLRRNSFHLRQSSIEVWLNISNVAYISRAIIGIGLEVVASFIVGTCRPRPNEI